jgi:phosphoenolpyruvate carboxylase
MGYLANTLGGVGLAIAKDPDGFVNLYAKSARMRLIISMVLWARAFSDIDTLKAYIDLTDPGRWLAWASRVADSERAADVVKVAEYLENFDFHVPLDAIFRLFQRDDMEMERGLATLEAALGEKVEKPRIDDAVRDDLVVLHALRLALIHELFVLAARVPEFSPQYGTTPEILTNRIVHLQVERAVELLGQIFPPYQNLALVDDFGEPATYRSQTTRGYEAQHREIFEPMAKLHTLIRRISTAVIHLIGATG